MKTDEELNTLQNELPKRLKQLRFENKVTGIEAAKRIGRTQATWSSWEHGTARPNTDIVLELCRAYGVCSSWLLGETNCRTIDEIRASGSATANGDGAVATAGLGNAVIATTSAKSANSDNSSTSSDKDRIKFLESQLEIAAKEKAQLLALLAAK